MTNEKNLLMISLMRKTVGFIAGSLSVLAYTMPAFADLVQCPDGPVGDLCRNSQAIGPSIGRLVGFAFIVAIVIALAWLIYGGVKWMVSGGDKSAVEEARNHVVASLVGLVIVFLSYFVLNFLLAFFLGQNITGLNIPRF